jgi:hypothetical protein
MAKKPPMSENRSTSIGGRAVGVTETTGSSEAESEGWFSEDLHTETWPGGDRDGPAEGDEPSAYTVSLRRESQSAEPGDTPLALESYSWTVSAATARAIRKLIEQDQREE